MGLEQVIDRVVPEKTGGCGETIVLVQDVGTDLHPPMECVVGLGDATQ